MTSVSLRTREDVLTYDDLQTIGRLSFRLTPGTVTSREPGLWLGAVAVTSGPSAREATC
jgi:hypothetical protein